MPARPNARTELEAAMRQRILVIDSKRPMPAASAF
jgi:hypothetical protein